eukprot:COSAG06_NODE_46917_length_343_cov_0.836066_1_plen_80_part_10
MYQVRAPDKTINCATNHRPAAGDPEILSVSCIHGFMAADVECMGSAMLVVTVRRKTVFFLSFTMSSWKTNDHSPRQARET